MNLKWCFVTKTFSGTQIHQSNNTLNIVIADRIKVRTLRKILSEKPVGILVSATLPRLIGRRKIRTCFHKGNRDILTA